MQHPCMTARSIEAGYAHASIWAPNFGGDRVLKGSQEKGKEFEDFCKGIIEIRFLGRNWVVEEQRSGSYGRIDFYVRRKGAGGRRLVFECKDMSGTRLRREDVDQARRYKRSGAKDAILLVSADTPVPSEVASYAEENGVVILPVRMREKEPFQSIRNVATVLWHVQ